MRSVYSKNGQNIWDIAIQYMGSADSVFTILELNPSLRVDNNIDVDTEILLPDNPINQHVVDYFSLNLIVPATGINP